MARQKVKVSFHDNTPFKFFFGSAIAQDVGSTSQNHGISSSEAIFFEFSGLCVRVLIREWLGTAQIRLGIGRDDRGRARHERDFVTMTSMQHGAWESTVFVALGWVGAVMSSLNLVPQVWRTIVVDKCDTRQVSMLMLFLNLGSGIFLLLYALNGRLWPIAITNALITVCSTMLIVAKCSNKSPTHNVDVDMVDASDAATAPEVCLQPSAPPMHVVIDARGGEGHGAGDTPSSPLTIQGRP